MSFDPTKYLRKLGKGDYLEVKWRLVWLRQEHPDAAIETELMRLDRDPPMAVFRAKVTIPGGGSATGWGQEEPKDFGDYLEKAETKALGRALAALGFGPQFTEDFDFAGDEGRRVVDSPVERPPQQHPNLLRASEEANREARAVANRIPPAPNHTGNGGGPVLPATEPQLRAIYAIGRAKQAMDDAEVEARCKELYGVTPSALSRRQASEFIDWINKQG